MKEVKVYGPGCKRCLATEAMVREAAAKLGIKVTVEKVTDLGAIARAGVMSTPGIAVDGKLVHARGLPDAAKLQGWLAAQQETRRGRPRLRLQSVAARPPRTQWPLVPR